MEEEPYGVFHPELRRIVHRTSPEKAHRPPFGRRHLLSCHLLSGGIGALAGALLAGTLSFTAPVRGPRYHAEGARIEPDAITYVILDLHGKTRYLVRDFADDGCVMRAASASWPEWCRSEDPDGYDSIRRYDLRTGEERHLRVFPNDVEREAKRVFRALSKEGPLRTHALGLQSRALRGLDEKSALVR